MARHVPGIFGEGGSNAYRRPATPPHRRRLWPAVAAALVALAAGSAEGGIVLRQEVADAPVYGLDGSVDVQTPFDTDAAGFAASLVDVERLISGEGAAGLDAATARAAREADDAAASERAWLYAEPLRPGGQARWGGAGFDGTAGYDAEFQGLDSAPGATLKELLKLYVNVVPSRRPVSTGGGEPKRDTGAGPERGVSSGDGVLEAVLASPAEAAIGRLISHIFRPSIGIDGLVSFSIMGFGNFAIVVTEDREQVGVIDIDTGRARTFSARSAPSGAAARSAAASGPREPRRPASRAATRLIDLVNAILDYLLETITSPLRMSVLLLLMLLWGVWRAHGRNV